MARLTHTATLLNNGMVLIAAAMDRGVTDLTSAETYLSAAVEPPPNTLQITPATANVAVGETQNFTAIDNYGNPRLDVIWTVSDPSLATVAPDEDNAAILTGIAAGRVLTG